MTRHDRACITYGLFLCAVVCFELSTCRGEAQTTDRIIKWTPSTRLLLAQVAIAEADWSEPDHAAIWHALRNRWVATDTTRTFEALVRAYASGFGKWIPARLARRLTWIRNLDDTGSEPDGWSRRKYGSWSHYRGKWLATLDRVDLFFAGELSDPCDGQATAWGGKMDIPNKRLRRVICTPATANWFYRSGL